MPPRFSLYKAPVTLGFTEVEAILSERTGIRRDDIRLVLDEFFYLVFEALRRGHNIRLAHIGFFNIVRTWPRLSWNSTTGKLQFVPSVHQVGFRVARSTLNKIFAYFTKGLEPVAREDYAEEVLPYHLQYALRSADKRLERNMLVDMEDYAFLKQLVEELKEKSPELSPSTPSEDEVEGEELVT